MNQKKWYKVIFILNVILFLLLLLHSCIFFFLNEYYNSYRFSHAPLDDAQLSSIYTTGRRIAESAGLICGKIYSTGHFIVLFLFLFTHSMPSPRICTVYFLIQTLLTGACTLPFGLIDSASLGDYLFPVWGILIRLAFFWIIALICSFIRKPIDKRGSCNDHES